MSTVAFIRDGVRLLGVEQGQGPVLLMQHGLGGDAGQVADTLPERSDWRRLTLNCRGQGGSEPGSRRPHSIAGFTEDVLAFCDARDARRVVAGGISMGAAIALRLAVRHPGRVRALLLVRPAWLFDPAPDGMRPYAEVADALRRAPSDEARALFAAGPTAARLRAEAPDNLASLLGFFDRPDPRSTADLLADIAQDGPGVSREEVAALRLPTLVVGHAADLVHTLVIAETLAATIPGARFVRVPPKGGDRAAHVAAVRAAITTFLDDLPPEPAP